VKTSKVENVGFWRGVGTLSVIFGAVTFLGSLVIAMEAYANQDTAMAGPIAALMGVGIIVGLVLILVGWALRASDKPKPPVIINQYQQDRYATQQFASRPEEPRAHKYPVTVVEQGYSPEPNAPVSYCQGCGRKIVPGAAFCEGCGRRLK